MDPRDQKALRDHRAILDLLAFLAKPDLKAIRATKGIKALPDREGLTELAAVTASMAQQVRGDLLDHLGNKAHKELMANKVLSAYRVDPAFLAPKEIQDTTDLRVHLAELVSRDTTAARDLRELQGPMAMPATRDTQDHRVHPEPKVIRDPMDHPARRDRKATQGRKDQRAQLETSEAKEIQATRDQPEKKGRREQKENKVRKGKKGRRACLENLV